MSVVASDIIFRLSTTSGAAGDTTAGTPGNLLGKYVATTAPVSGSLHAILTAESAAENAASQVDYGCLFVLNNNATTTATNAKIWLSNDVAGGCTFAIGVDTTAASAKGSSSAQALTIANDTTAPAGVTFSAPSDYASGLTLGDIPAGYVKAFWVRRTAANTTAVANDGTTFNVRCETT